MHREIAQHLDALSEICRRHGISRLWLFGSAARASGRDLDQASDLDFLVEIDRRRFPLRGFADPYWQLLFDMQSLFTRRVDLVEVRDFKDNAFADELQRSRELIYDGAREKAAG